MLKRLKSVSMLLFLMGASTGAAYAVANPGVADVKITQKTGTVSYTHLSGEENICFWMKYTNTPTGLKN